MALQLKKAGIGRVRPLAGGLERWVDLNYPVEPSGAALGEPLSTAGQRS